MSSTLLRRTTAGFAAFTIGAGALVGVATSASAAANPVPQAPVLSVISSAETLPFTLAGGGPIEVAVLTGSQTPASATWTTTSQLALDSYQGKTIRVLARAVGVTDSADWFDATYDVRDAYASALGNGTTANPVTAIHGNDDSFRAWTKTLKDYQPGTNVGPTWLAQAQQIVGQEQPADPHYGTGYEGNTGGVVLGDHGRVTADFRSPVRDGAGPDLAVFENGFRVNGTSDADFVELAYVEVSSNGTDFVRFDSGTTNTTPIGGFVGLQANKYGGLAGRDLNGYGTPFDLRALKNKPEVRSGLVNLQAITEVRIVDAVGDGNDLDSFGRPIYDPYPTADSGGFDLSGIGVINQVGASVTGGNLVRTGPDTASVYAAVSAGTAASVTPYVEYTEDVGLTNLIKRWGTYVPPGDGYTATKFDLWGLEKNKVYFYRVAADVAGGSKITGSWKQFSTAGAAEITGSQLYIYDDVAKVDVKVDPGTSGDDLQLHLDVGDLWGEIPTTSTPSKTVVGSAGAQKIRFELSGIPQDAYRTLVMVLVDKDGNEVWRQSAGAVLLPGQRPSADDLRVTSNENGSVSVLGTATQGTYGAYKIHAELTKDPTHQNVVATPADNMDTWAQEKSWTFDDLTPGVRYWVRYVMIPDEGDFTFTTDWVKFTSDAAPRALGETSASAITKTGATVAVPVTAGDFARSVSIEYTDRPDLTGVTTTPIQTVAVDTTPTLTAALTGLKPATDHWFRAVSRVGDDVERTAWKRFTTAGGEKATFTVGSLTSPVKAGAKVTVNGSGLNAAEAFRISVGGIEVGTGTATAAGTVSRVITAPGTLAEGRHAVVITGLNSTRAGSTPLTIVRTKALTVSVKAKSVAKNGKQTVTVRGLVAGEKVTVTWRGKKISAVAAKANAAGVYTLTFKVGKATGKGTIAVQGLDKSRSGKVTITVKKK